MERGLDGKRPGVVDVRTSLQLMTGLPWISLITIHGNVVQTHGFSKMVLTV